MIFKMSINISFYTQLLCNGCTVFLKVLQYSIEDKSDEKKIKGLTLVIKSHPSNPQNITFPFVNCKITLPDLYT